MTDSTLVQGDPVERILRNAALVKEQALAIDTSRTEDTTAGALQVGDVILSLGNAVFPFPFTLTGVQRLDRYGKVTLRAAHGWFTMTAPSVDESCVRVVA